MTRAVLQVQDGASWAAHSSTVTVTGARVTVVSLPSLSRSRSLEVPAAREIVRPSRTVVGPVTRATGASGSRRRSG